MANYFSINTIMFTLAGYPMSYIEFFGTIFNLWSVWLVAKNKILNWPVGIIGVFFFLLLYYQVNLYSDFIEQIYYLLTGFYGWWVWARVKNNSQNQDLAITTTSKQGKLVSLVCIGLGTLVLGYVMSHIHTYFPAVFTQAASFPYLDALTTVASFVATILLAYKKLETWYLWILVDVIGIWLYYVKEVKFISLLYGVFLILAISGYITWRKAKI
jgi:nicotinamide mononucleotide transporter